MNSECVHLRVLIKQPTVATWKALTEIAEAEKGFLKVKYAVALNIRKNANVLAIVIPTGCQRHTPILIFTRDCFTLTGGIFR